MGTEIEIVIIPGKQNPYVSDTVRQKWKERLSPDSGARVVPKNILKILKAGKPHDSDLKTVNEYFIDLNYSHQKNEMYWVLDLAYQNNISLSKITKNTVVYYHDYEHIEPFISFLIEYQSLDKTNLSNIFEYSVREQKTSVLRDIIDSGMTFSYNGQYINSASIEILQLLMEHDLLTQNDLSSALKSALTSNKEDHITYLKPLIPEKDFIKIYYNVKEGKTQFGWKEVSPVKISHVEKLPQGITLQHLFDFETKEITTITQSKPSEGKAICHTERPFQSLENPDKIRTAYNELVKRGHKPPEPNLDKYTYAKPGALNPQNFTQAFSTKKP